MCHGFFFLIQRNRTLSMFLSIMHVTRHFYFSSFNVFSLFRQTFTSHLHCIQKTLYYKMFSLFIIMFFLCHKNITIGFSGNKEGGEEIRLFRVYTMNLVGFILYINVHRTPFSPLKTFLHFLLSSYLKFFFFFFFFCKSSFCPTF